MDRDVLHGFLKGLREKTAEEKPYDPYASAQKVPPKMGMWKTASDHKYTNFGWVDKLRELSRSKKVLYGVPIALLAGGAILGARTGMKNRPKTREDLQREERYPPLTYEPL